MRNQIRNLCNIIWNYNRKKYIKRHFNSLNNSDFTLISCNCTGGVLYHDLGMQFLSPTINMYLNCEDFIKLCENLEYYLSLEMEEYNGNIKRDYPLAALGDITLYLVHYKTIEEASEKWKQRKERINWDNIYVIGTDRDGYNEDLSERFDKLPYKKVLFTHCPDDNPNHFYIRGYENEPQVGTIVEKSDLLSGKRVLDQFDWINFLNK